MKNTFHAGPPCRECRENGHDVGRLHGVLITPESCCAACGTKIHLNGLHGPAEPPVFDMVDPSLYPTTKPFEKDDAEFTQQFTGARLDDVGNGERFIMLHRDRVQYVPEWGWLVYDGRRWERDNKKTVAHLAKDTLNAMHSAVATGRVDPTTDHGKKWLNWAMRSGSSGKIASMLEMASSEPGVAIDVDRFDADKDVIAANNRVVELETGRMARHNRLDLVTKLCGTDYDTEAKCPTWTRFLAEVCKDDPELMEYLQCAVGYTLTGQTREQCLFFLWGSGSNGKSTFLGVLQELLGDYATTLPMDALLRNKHSKPENTFARLPGVRLAVAMEAGEGRSFDEQSVKTLTGGDELVGEFKYKDAFKFRPQVKIWIGANAKPTIYGVDDGIWRRWRLIPFTAAFRDEDKDEELPEKLRAELPGILAWAVRGAIKWYESGLPPCKRVDVATAEYRAENDTVATWIEEECAVGPDYMESHRVLLREFNAWAKDHHERELTSKAFALRLKAWNNGALERMRPNSGVAWKGLQMPITQRQGLDV